MMHARKTRAIVVSSVAAAALAVIVLGLAAAKTAYDEMARLGADLLWHLDEGRIAQAHALLDPDAGRLLTVEDMDLVDAQLDRLIGKAGSAKWAGTFRVTWISPPSAVIAWKVHYALVPQPVTVTMSFIRREGSWKIGGIWYDSPEIRKTPLLVSVRFAASLDETLGPRDVKGTFTAADGSVVAWTLWQSLNGPHAVRIEWLDPTGVVACGFTYEVKGKPERKSRVVYSRMDLGSRGSPRLPGEWKVRVALDSRTIVEKTVIISAKEP
jgi:hypothetical protein